MSVNPTQTFVHKVCLDRYELQSCEGDQTEMEHSLMLFQRRRVKIRKRKLENGFPLRLCVVQPPEIRGSRTLSKQLRHRTGTRLGERERAREGAVGRVEIVS